MVKLLTTGWTFKRVLFLIVGITLLGQGITESQWALIAFGGYFTFLSVFKKGCCADNCGL